VGGEIEAIRTLTDRALAGKWVGEAAFDGLRLLCAEVAIPRAMIDDHIAGFALDAEGWRPQSKADLIRYCHHVAGAVGQMMALVMGVREEDEDTLGRADDLGIAFQLANIARDVREDAEGGRVYLPAEWLNEGVSEIELVRRLTDLVGPYEDSAQIGARRLPFRSRWAVLAAAGIYGGIARTIAADPERALRERVVTSRGAKLSAVMRAFGQAL
jgi:phytoene synthase